ncbi:LOW QUALITY PROTEIN: hypothetical protein V1478_016964 [Vespula squamosa]|uniref:Uncharacterized protein n=1 Tax=Vespula squamosa TaxID=30214 RepID=A0ABD1ZY23_VESSQ
MYVPVTANSRDRVRYENFGLVSRLLGSWLKGQHRCPCLAIYYLPSDQRKVAASNSSSNSSIRSNSNSNSKLTAAKVEMQGRRTASASSYST